MKNGGLSPDEWADRLIECCKDEDFYWAIDRLRQAKEKKEWGQLKFDIKGGNIKLRTMVVIEKFEGNGGDEN